MSWAGWPEVESAQFLEHSNEIDVLWRPDLWSDDIRVREGFMRNKRDWARFRKNCFLPWYKGGLNYDDAGSVNYSLRKHAKEEPTKLKSDRNMLLLSAFHISANLRLIVDGCNRANAIESEIKKRHVMPTVRVVECYGSRIDQVFYADFGRLLDNRAVKFCRENLARNIRVKRSG